MIRLFRPKPSPREIDLREQARGGGGRQFSSISIKALKKPRDKLVLLIHGYNVSRRGAGRDFHRFEKNISSFTQTLDGDLFRVYWPGDSWVPGLRALGYLLKVQEAKESSEKLVSDLYEWCELFQELKHFEKPCHLILIGHSLGCRLILEACEILKSKEGNRKEKERVFDPVTVILMAAAVPVEYVKKDRSLRKGVEYAKQAYVFFSSHDQILSLVFGPAQRFALGEERAPGEKRVFPEAVGLHGKPVLLWKDRISMAGYGHGDYWKEKDTAQYVAHLLDRRVSRPRPKHVLPVRRGFWRRPGPPPRPPIKRRVNQFPQRTRQR